MGESEVGGTAYHGGGWSEAVLGIGMIFRDCAADTRKEMNEDREAERR